MSPVRDQTAHLPPSGGGQMNVSDVVVRSTMGGCEMVDVRVRGVRQNRARAGRRKYVHEGAMQVLQRVPVLTMVRLRWCR